MEISPEPDRVVLVVDAANVVGSRPDGWWRDRAGAAGRLLSALLPATGAVLDGPLRPRQVRIAGVRVVLEGAARAAAVPPGAADRGLLVVLAAADGDSEVVAQAQQVLAAGERPLVVTADRGLRARLPGGCEVTGPSWLRAALLPGGERS